MSDLQATFKASLPPIQSALKIGDGAMRVQFDIPASELHEAMKLALMHGQVLLVTVAVVPDENAWKG
jgi:hypothetical protein